ncbi:hypothetical protein FB45DRAFT_1063591 [Roridomyces roridus]|uniref:Transmembrane protein n=1 Tax=Roridomyces roridus TaxID=1738132 RepID=A0AAD7BCK9_9AGAR|nr:hypothetical protein FB45DRAFT_1069561 [Roridomyces roridus]KAJ7617028.1 hypothetical protein FB45DRAFT_1063591 [Roridomyces roridus]
MSTQDLSRDKMFGALLVGTYINSFIYILEVVEMIKYFRRRASDDRLYVKGAVLLALVTDSLATAAADGIVYLNTVTHWGDASFSTTRSQIIPIFMVLTGVSAAIAHVYLSSQYWNITKNRFLTALSILTMLVSLAGVGLFAAALFKLHPISDRASELRVPGIFWLAASVVSDILLVVTLVAGSEGLRDIGASFSRVCDALLQTNTFGAVFSLASFIVFVVDKQETNLSFAISISLGRVYTHAMLRHLNAPREPQVSRTPSFLRTLQLGNGRLTDPFQKAQNGRPFISTPIALEFGSPTRTGKQLSISAPMLIEDPTPENLAAGRELLKQKKKEMWLERTPSL